MFLFVALSGVIVGSIVNVSPSVIILAVGSTVIPVTFTIFLFTVTLHIAVLLPDVAVIIAVPSLTPITSPVLETVAIAGLSDIHVTVLLAGVVVAFKVNESPTSIVFSEISNNKLVTSSVSDDNCTLTVRLVDIPFSVVAVIVVSPEVPFLKISPWNVTSATSGLLLVQVILSDELTLLGLITGVKQLYILYSLL